MDDSCAVCAETLQWVAYGPCGHREVCSTCIIRLRFICGDSHCCICKSESRIVFVSKALGNYTRMINDFSVFPADPMEGQVGLYWYHEGTQAFFDDPDHYKMIKAMCRLSCGVCDKINELRSEGSKRKGEFKNVELLKNHLFHLHGLFMCSLCLGSRKIFICEQKLYTKAQLDRHTETGDSEVDGSETERGGFNGHPMCDFCKNPFYGDNELYMHMSTDHYTCHMCQRQHPGQYEYYNKYDDLENHFSQAHFLCKDEDCLTKKFVVFATESEIKRHNAKEHGGNMSRSRRNIALQIPVSFRFRRSNEQELHGRGHGSHFDAADNQLSLALQASLDTTTVERCHNTSSSTQEVFIRQETNELETIVGSFESLATAESEPSSRCSHELRENSRNELQQESAFPPLPVAQSDRRFRNGSEGLSGNTMASRIRRLNKVTVLNSSRSWSTTNRQPKSSASSSHQKKPSSASGLMSSSSSPVFSPSKTAPVRQAVTTGFVSSNFASSRNSTGTGKVTHSSSPPNLIKSGSLNSDFPSVSATQTNKEPASSLRLPRVRDVHTVNKSLVEKIRDALESDENKFSAFKEISAEYRKDIINTEEYLAYVYQFGLSHLVLELARLCPDAEKQRELVETYNFNMKSSGSHEINLCNGSSKSRSKSSKKGKEKCEDNGISSSKYALPDCPINPVRNLQSNHKPRVEDAAILLKDAIHSAKGKSKISIEDVLPGNQMLTGQNGFQSTGGSSNKNLGTGGGGNKQRKKTPKFLRNRLGNDATELSELGDCEEKKDGDKDPPEGLPVHGVWQNGGGHRLVKMTMRDHIKR
ncbi:PREDICTED: zinc [Prunus dulcis]|uniref:PREDICTED: zinc n=2 Tax=Prunus dulcis TaxID=3755 RepID=A0A5E4GCS4_PRUDU|nr:E3 ubiquitin-protein ligase ZNF598-like isoform X1 [Prunus dulcis]XP_034221711.1 E3 ubiquitin-protein ligase ZNF598-like isoform X1 [Prunus dulcis]VVA37471.1 PREDICTED: zinc [Prunus dulcis]